MLRINLFAGPCSSKSRTASKLFGHLVNHRIELVTEYVKEWAYQGRQISGFDQIKIFAEQLTKEESVLKSGLSLVTDSPLALQLVYAQKYGFESWPHLMGICKDFDLKYPSINLFLNRDGIKYDQIGRYETESEARELDNRIRYFLLHNYHLEFQEFSSLDFDSIFKFVETKLGEFQK